MDKLKFCLNPKVLAGLGVAALAVFAIAPGFVISALPVLLLLACPLSMLLMPALMGKNMHGSGSHQAAGGAYACPMHPEAISTGPGRCPLCGMAMVPAGGQQPSVPSASRVTREAEIAILKSQVERLQTEQVDVARRLAELTTQDDPGRILPGPAAPTASTERADSGA